MANYFAAVWAELNAKIDAVWDDISINFNAKQAARVNWRNMVAKAQAGGTDGFKPPYSVVQLFPVQPTADWGMDNHTYFLQVNIFYIASTTSTDDISALIDEEISAMRDALMPGASETSAYQIIEEPTVDNSESNPANQYFLSVDLPMLAGMVTVRVLVGESA